MNTRDYANGNYYQDEKGNIEKLDTFEVSFGILEYPLNLKPIPLTEEVLLRCGFVHQFKSYKQDFFSLNIDELIYLTFDLRKNRITLHSYLLGVIKTFDYNYLHQLQNLFYSLRNEELQYNHSQDI